MNEPNYGCQDIDCATEISYPAEMLRLWKDQPICENCYWESIDGVKPHWSDLPPFIPEHEKEIARLREVLKMYADPFDELPKQADPPGIPDFYDELDFGRYAREALGE